MLERIHAGVLTERDLADPATWRLTGDLAAELLRFERTRRPISTVLAYEEARVDLARAWVRDDRGREMVIRVWMDPAHPGVPSRFSQVLAPAGYIVRTATEGDAAALTELERRVGVLRADGSTVVYHRPDPFAQFRLMGNDVAPLVVEYQGEIIGAHVDAFHQVRIGGRDADLMYRLHTRVLPEHQGAGLYGTMTGVQLERFRGSEPIPALLAFAAVGNSKVDRFTYWETRVQRVTIECAAVAGAATAATRTAGPADAERIADMTNVTHRDREFFVPLDADAVCTRLERSASDYGFSSVGVGDRAVAGVWDAGWGLVVTRDGTTVEEQRLASLADWAALAGGEDQLVDLVRGWCAELVERGVTHLLAFADERSAAGRAICSLASSVTVFRTSSTVNEPPGTGDRGIYVDPIWF